MRVKTFEEVMQLTRTVSSDTALSDEEAKGLYDACLMVPLGGMVVEVGCQLGRSSSLIAQLAHDKPFRSVHIDPYTDQPEYLRQWHEMMWEIGGRDHAYLHLCMRTQQASRYIHDLCRSGIDLAYIDGDHEYPGVLADLETLCPGILPRGHLAMHDYGHDSLPGVYKAAREYLKDDEWDQVGVYGTLGVWRKL